MVISEQVAELERGTYLDPDDLTGEGGEAQGGDGEGIRRREGPGVAGEHADLKRLLEHFGERIRRRCRVEQERASATPSRPPPAAPIAGASMPSSRASSATSATRFNMKRRKSRGCGPRAGSGNEGEWRPDHGEPVMERGS